MVAWEKVTRAEAVGHRLSVFNITKGRAVSQCAIQGMMRIGYMRSRSIAAGRHAAYHGYDPAHRELPIIQPEERVRLGNFS